MRQTPFVVALACLSLLACAAESGPEPISDCSNDTCDVAYDEEDTLLEAIAACQLQRDDGSSQEQASVNQTFRGCVTAANNAAIEGDSATAEALAGLRAGDACPAAAALLNRGAEDTSGLIDECAGELEAEVIAPLLASYVLSEVPLDFDSGNYDGFCDDERALAGQSTTETEALAAAAALTDCVDLLVPQFASALVEQAAELGLTGEGERAAAAMQTQRTLGDSFCAAIVRDREDLDGDRAQVVSGVCNYDASARHFGMWVGVSWILDDYVDDL